MKPWPLFQAEVEKAAAGLDDDITVRRVSSSARKLKKTKPKRPVAAPVWDSDDDFQ
jgi:hypothetical protein